MTEIVRIAHSTADAVERSEAVADKGIEAAAT